MLSSNSFKYDLRSPEMNKCPAYLKVAIEIEDISATSLYYSLFILIIYVLLKYIIVISLSPQDPD